MKKSRGINEYLNDMDIWTHDEINGTVTISLTEQQQYRINMKYELINQLARNTGTKRYVYRAIADKYGYSMERIEDIARKELFK